LYSYRCCNQSWKWNSFNLILLHCDKYEGKSTCSFSVAPNGQNLYPVQAVHDYIYIV